MLPPLPEEDEDEGWRRVYSAADALVCATRNGGLAMMDDSSLGTLEAGKMADVVLWNGNPFSTYTRPDKVWIDGALMYDSANPRLRPVTLLLAQAGLLSLRQAPDAPARRDLDVALLGRDISGDDAEKRSFTCAIAADQADEFTLFHFK